MATKPIGLPTGYRVYYSYIVVVLSNASNLCAFGTFKVAPLFVFSRDFTNEPGNTPHAVACSGVKTPSDSSTPLSALIQAGRTCLSFLKTMARFGGARHVRGGATCGAEVV